MATKAKAKASSAWEVEDWETADFGDEPEPLDAKAQSSANARLWDQANSKPSYDYDASGSLTSRIPPPQSFSPSLKILKRPTASSASSSNQGSRSSTPTTEEGRREVERRAMEERERKYREARARIFGEEAVEATPTPTPTPTAAAAREGSAGRETGGGEGARKEVEVVRNPSGPEDGQRGFHRPR